jgi:serine/threonine-protein kinase HipA
MNMHKRENRFRVFLHDRPVGRLLQVGDYTRFVFDREYIDDSSRAVLGLRFEENLTARFASNMRLPPWFSNLLPEGRLREWIGEDRGVNVSREMELLAQVGHDLPGAVRVLPDGEDSDEEAFEVDATAQSMAGSEPNRWRFSLAGVGLKFSMLAKGDRFTAPAFGEGGDWIVKLPDPDHSEVPRNEFAMMSLARRAGIQAPEVRLVHRDQTVDLPDNAWPRGEEFAYAVRRFDRGPGRELIHIEDLAQVRGFYPDDKYVGTFETIGALAFRGHDTEALQEFARRLAFNVLIRNGDSHLKNWSLIYRDQRMPTLSPAYDLVSTAIYKPASQGPEDLGLKFGGNRRFEAVTLSKFAALEQRLKAQADLEGIVADFVQNVAREWPAAEQILESNLPVCKVLWDGIATGRNQLLNHARR